jgi:hypothetical protein
MGWSDRSRKRERAIIMIAIPDGERMVLIVEMAMEARDAERDAR